MASTGVPIRLVRNDGGLIPLLAENITFTVDRSVPTMSLPLTGNTRIGMDINMAKAMIVISGILADDELNHSELGTYSKGSIDFSHAINGQNWYESGFASETNFDRYITLFADNAGPNGANFRFLLDGGTGIGTAVSSTGLGNTEINVPIQGATSAADITAKIKTAVEQTSHPSGLAYKPGDYFTANQKHSNYTNASSGQLGYNAVIEFVHSTLGATSGSTPAWAAKDGYSNNATAGANYWNKPYITNFSGGSLPTNQGKSAGDKAMDLYGTLNNMNNGGGGSLTGPGLAAIGYEMIASGLSGEGWTGPLKAQENKYGDYIIGIQIPYHSKVQADTGRVQRNFFMPTGGFHDRDSKGSEANENTVSVDFSPYDEMTGIKGTVKQFQMSYDAGETVYNYQISFLPVDWIL
jgi:hypothetical protein